MVYSDVVIWKQTNLISVCDASASTYQIMFFQIKIFVHHNVCKMQQKLKNNF